MLAAATPAAGSGAIAANISANLIITAASPTITGSKTIKATVPNAATAAITHATKHIAPKTPKTDAPATTARAINAAAPNTSAKTNAA